jgi:arylsulfatase A-like enzyme
MPFPNVIVFFSDQQRWDTTGVHGNPCDLTPNFDRMARRGTDVHYSFTCQPVCGAARSTLQTGQYGTTTGCYRNGVPLPRQARTLAHHFADAGYHTAYIGKWHLGSDEGPTVLHERGGYQTWLAANLLEFTSDAYQTRLFDRDNQPVDLPGYRADAITDAAIRFIAQAAKNEQPFYLFISYLEPHHQNSRDDYPAPEGYAERFAGRWMPADLNALGGSAHRHMAGYMGMVKRLDECLGRLMDALRSLHLDDDTILFYTSDHGNHFKTRNDEYKRSPHESSIRVPTAAQGRDFNGGGRLPQLVSLIDIPPTLLDAAGLPVPADMQGRSFMPLVRRQPTAWPDDLFVQVSESEIGRAVRTRRWKYTVAADGDAYAQPDAAVYRETALYDLLADPYELNNLIGGSAYAEAASVMRQRLARRMCEAGEQAPQIVPAPAYTSFEQLHVSSAEAHT